MDLYCTSCGEPWDMDYVNFEMTSEERNHFKHGEGCPACYGKEMKKRPVRAQIAGVFREILGDDEDGIASAMDDAEFLLGKDFWE